MKRILSLLVVLGFATTLFAQDLGLKSITVKGGIILPEDPWDTGFHIGANANMGQIIENVTLVPFAEYWSTGYDQTILGDSYGLDLSNIKIGAAGHYAIANVPGLYAGAGLALNFLTIDVVVPGFLGFGGGTSSDTSTEFGAVVLAGYKIPVGSYQGVIEAEYNLMEVATLQFNFGIEFDM